MKKVIAALSLCTLALGCAYYGMPIELYSTPNKDLGRQLVHCGAVANSLSQSDPKYKQYSSTFLGAATTLTSVQFVTYLMTDGQTTIVDNSPRNDKEREIMECQSLLKDNMSKLGKATSH